MVFHKNILQSFPWRAESLVEDTEYTFVLLENGIPIRFLPEVRVASAFPTSRNDLQVQRTRWTGGSLTVGLHKGLRLMRKGISQARWLWIDAGFTSLILNRSFIVVQLALTALISFILYFFSSDRWTFCVSMGCFTMIAAYFIYALTGVILLGLTKHRIMLMLQTPWVALRYLVMTLIILSGKIPLTWQRTSRSSSNHLT
jgi:cellulose synthase/poly-beta-1,6-N-acetylglucosamine synthase-like glycosyltransferase